MNSCLQCKFVHSTPNPDGEARPPALACRRYPPAAFPMQGEHPITRQPIMAIQSFFPSVNDAMMCGEFEQVVTVQQ